MTHNHEHACDHKHNPSRSRRNLSFVFAATMAFTAAEALGGWLTNSLALMSDAGHMLTDSAALGLSLFALKIGEMPPTTTKTFGYRRFEILAALLNGLALWAIVGMILREAYERIAAPQNIHAGPMIAIAAVGLAINLVSMKLLHSHAHESINIRGAFLHVAADSLGSVGAVAAGFVVMTTGWNLADPLISLVICFLILWSSWGLVRDSVHHLLLGVPPHIDFHEVEKVMLGCEGVCCVYDLHIWSIAGGQEALSAHIVVPDGYGNQKQLLKTLICEFQNKFKITHTTIQIEESHEFKKVRGDAVCQVEGAGKCGSPS